MVQVPHAVLEILNSQGHYWLSNSDVTQYQTLVCETPLLTFQLIKPLNWAAYLLTELTPKNDCLALADESRRSLPMKPLTDAEDNLFMDWSSSVKNGTHHPRDAVVTLEKHAFSETSLEDSPPREQNSGRQHKLSTGPKEKRWIFILTPGIPSPMDLGCCTRNVDSS